MKFSSMQQVHAAQQWAAIKRTMAQMEKVALLVMVSPHCSAQDVEKVRADLMEMSQRMSQARDNARHDGVTLP